MLHDLAVGVNVLCAVLDLWEVRDSLEGVDGQLDVVDGLRPIRRGMERREKIPVLGSL
jgi:hypothetical protein